MLSAISARPGAFGLTPSPENLAGSQQQVGEALEGMFVSILIKTMRESIDGDGLFPGDSSDVLGTLFDQTMGDHIAKGGGLGLAQFFNDAVEARQSTDSNQRSTAGEVNSTLNGK